MGRLSFCFLPLLALVPDRVLASEFRRELRITLCEVSWRVSKVDRKVRTILLRISCAALAWSVH
jgi:hypothetical protein